MTSSISAPPWIVLESGTPGFYPTHPFVRIHRNSHNNIAAIRSKSSRKSSVCVSTTSINETEGKDINETVKIVGIVGQGSLSPLNSASWHEVMLHTAKRLKWVDDGFEMVVFTDNIQQSSDETVKNLTKDLHYANMLVLISVHNEESVKWIQQNSQNIPNIVCFESSPGLSNKLGGSLVQRKTRVDIFSKLSEISQPKKANESEEVVKTIYDAWDRHNSDDIRFSLLVIINAYIRPVSILKNLRAQGFSTLSCMVKNCGPQVFNCLLDPNCRKALQCLNQCSPVDQKNNCLELEAKIPEKPYVSPMNSFRGKDLSHEIAEDLFVGCLGNLDWSWRVVAGQNPAYDQFPCQYQLFYRGKARGSFWYEPVFQVKTLEGGLVWRRRKYRVKRSKVPGTFNFTVLDNGVVSNEFWTIVDVAADFSWGLFHYSGAARVAGQSYTGAVLVSPNGEYPDERERGRLVSALDRCHIKEWELFNVDNCSCKDPPLGLPEGSSLHKIIKVEDLKGSFI
uniref:VDE lipocalin domain-containing protein n=1 Tax=Daucus carota subsp. sativus TaxID=79200 RepID=A0A161Y0P5_DAUCS